VGGIALGHRQAVAPPDQRFRLPRHVELKREIVRALVTRHVQDVAKTERRDHADPHAAPFNDHVGRDSCAVIDRVDCARLDAGQRTDLQYPLDNRF
jgi:hypothetical protein